MPPIRPTLPFSEISPVTAIFLPPINSGAFNFATSAKANAKPALGPPTL